MLSQIKTTPVYPKRIDGGASSTSTTGGGDRSGGGGGRGGGGSTSGSSDAPLADMSSHTTSSNP